MAHLVQLPDSDRWWGSLTGADGRRVRCSCGTSNRTEALSIRLAWERTSKEARQGILTEARVRRVLSDTLEHATGAPLPGGSIREDFHEWVDAKQKEKATRTGMKYAQVAEHFLSSQRFPRFTLGRSSAGTRKPEPFLASAVRACTACMTRGSSAPCRYAAVVGCGGAASSRWLASGSCSTAISPKQPPRKTTSPAQTTQQPRTQRL